jgi:hypothetical protein
MIGEYQNPHADRITEILQRRAEAQAPQVNPQEYNALGVASIADVSQGPMDFLNAVNNVRDRRTLEQETGFQKELQSAQSVYDIFEQRKAAGDKQAQALSDKIKMFTGGDPAGTALFLEELNADPEDIDPSNAYQVMTKLAGIAKKTGYQSPEQKMAQLDLQQKQLGLKQTQASIAATNALAQQRSTPNTPSKDTFGPFQPGITGAKPQSTVGKLAADYQAGLIDKTTYDALIAKASGTKSEQKPLPVAALKLQNEALDIIGTSSSINDRLQKNIDQLAGGKLQLGPVSNTIGSGLNYAGLSTENSRNVASFISNLEKLRNDSLRLNKGVQTEGDAVRAWNEILTNINDEKLVEQRLKEVIEINKRAAELQKLQVDQIRANYGAEPIDTGAFENPLSQDTVPSEAVAELMNDPSPEARIEFDEAFGAGASERVLGGM